MLIPIKHIAASDFLYDLPEDRIARFPIEERDQSLLAVRWPDGRLLSDVFENLPHYLPKNSLLIVNNSRVIPARLVFSCEKGAEIEIFCLTPHEPAEYENSMASASSCSWVCMVGNLRRFKTDWLEMPIQIDDLKLQLRAYKRGFKNNQVLIDFSWNHPSIDFATILSVIGQTPLPPYLKRKPTAIDKLRYQTVYSKLEGSVAAPTAGLHFTDRVFEKLRKRDISILEATLHVGAGTFQPIKSAKVSQHSMHEEVIVLTPDLVRALANADTPVICVGTTALRTLESLYWLGVKHILGQETEYRLSQWECYSLPQSFSPKLAFEGLLSKMKNEQQQKIYARTSLMIVPGYTFKTTQALITNFHQPGSTLLLLVAAFIGKSWKELYQYAMQNQYRFLSYGDSSLLFH